MNFILDVFSIFFGRVIDYIERMHSRYKWIKFRSTINNLDVDESVIFKKIPHIQIHGSAKLVIGKNTTINSDNYGYHVNMFSATKLMADKKGAVIEIGSNTRIHGSCIHAYKQVTIGDNCLIAANCQILDNSGHELSPVDFDQRIHSIGKSKPVIIADSVWLGTGCIVLPGVTIGRGSVIAANSVVNRNIPDMVLAGGNPIKIIKSIALVDN